MPQPVLLTGPASLDLGTDIAEILGWPLVAAKQRVFPDSETCLDAVLPPETETCAIIQGTHPPQDRNIIQLMQLIQIARDHGCARIPCVVPYLAYSRQDRRSFEGEAVTARIVLEMLLAAGATELIVVDVHNEAIFGQNALPCTNLSAQPVFARALRESGLSNPVLVATDAGGGRRLEGLTHTLGWETHIMEKVKTTDGTTHYEAAGFNLTRRDVAILDDLCSSGSTLVPLVDRLKQCGARRILIGITHFFAEGEAALLERLGPGVELIYTDTTARCRGKALQVAPEIARHLTQEPVFEKAAE